jgi:hypothetical protein
MMDSPQTQSNNKKYQDTVHTYYNALIDANYTEEPVDVWTFITHPNYLGNVTGGGKDVFPCWQKALKEMFSDNGKFLIVLTGAIGIGKSSVALYALAYIQYRLMILKEPWKFFNLADAGKMTISFFNLNKSLGDSRGYQKLQYYLAQSPWFRKNAVWISKEGDILEFKLIKYALASPYGQGFGIIGEDVVAGILDEVDTPISAQKMKERVVEAYNATVIRFRTRFAPNNYSLGKLFVVSSKQDELSFVETFVVERKDSPELLVFDIPYWEAKPKYHFSGETFPIAIGDAFNPSKVIDESEVVAFVQNGYKIVRPPIEFKKEFQMDLAKSLREIAGMTMAGARKFKIFPSEKAIVECFDPNKEDPSKMGTINVGLKDEGDLIWYLDLTKIRLDKGIPRCIHFDISVSGDASGISMAGIKEWKTAETLNPDGTYKKEIVPVIETDFILRVKARDGDRIPLHKLRKLVLDLRTAGYNIFRFSADLVLASEDTRQLLQAAGIECEYISLDRSNQAYYDFVNLVHEKRWVCHRRPRLLFELRNLEQLDGKIDHPAKVTDLEFLSDGSSREIAVDGTKDEADATVGAVFQCLKYNKRPMNTQLMVDLLNKTSSKTPTLESEIGKALMRDAQGQEIIGTKGDENQADKIASIFRKINRGR